MIKLINHGGFLTTNGFLTEAQSHENKEAGHSRTITYQILKAHNHSDNIENLRLKFDALVSPDNNYVNILQTARASGVQKFPIPYVLSNCHNTLCAVGGTINEDDHVYGMGNVQKYGGVFLPKYAGILHQYMREAMAGCGKMILGSDSHTRYGALGTLGIGEGGGEVVKQLLGKTYDIKMPPIIGVKLTGTPRPGIGPMDVALTMIGATFKNGFNKNKILEFIGSGIANLSVEFRMGIDVMTTESAALSSIWCTDEQVNTYLTNHGRPNDYQELQPLANPYYDGLIEIDLARVESMIALPYHPSNVMSIKDFKANMAEILSEIEQEGQQIKGTNSKKPFSILNHFRNGEFYPDQAIVSGCSGGMFENIAAIADILAGYSIPSDGMRLSINPASLPVATELMNQGIISSLAISGVTVGPAICGPCFGTTDAPADNQISIRHVTRNYPNREGSKPGQGQMAGVCLMDARSIAATIRSGGRLTPATDLEVSYSEPHYYFHQEIYKNQVFNNVNNQNPDIEPIMGPNIADWPKMYPLTDHLLLKAVGAYAGSVTTDALIPSGEATAFRSNPEKISEFTLINYDSDYVGRAKEVHEKDLERRLQGRIVSDEQLQQHLEMICQNQACEIADITIGSFISSNQIGDGSSREQAASCQKILGGYANIANEYLTKRYRSNLINWGIIPFLTSQEIPVQTGDYILVRNIRKAIIEGCNEICCDILSENSHQDLSDGCQKLSCTIGDLTEDEQKILLAGGLINYYQSL